MSKRKKKKRERSGKRPVQEKGAGDAALRAPSGTARWIFPVLLVLVTAVCFSPSLRGDINTWDDQVHLSRHKTVRSLEPENIRRMFTETVNRTYIPLTTLSFALEYHFFGYDPFIYHLDNILLHIGVVLLLYGLGIRLGLAPPAAFAGSLIFAVHPMHVESVAWATERKDVLYAFFYILSLRLYTEYAISGRRRPYILSVLCALLSILAKAMALSLPLVLFVIDWFLKRRRGIRLFLEKVPHMAAVFPIAWITYSLHARPVGETGGQAFLIWVWTAVFYPWKFFFPATLVPLYEMPRPVTVTNPVFGGALALFVLLLAAVVRLRRHRLFLFAVFYYFCSIFFLLRYDDTVDLNIVADRFMYLPSAGICLWLGHLVIRGFKEIKARRPAFFPVVLALCAAAAAWLGLKTYRLTSVWENNKALWTYVSRHYPENPHALFGLGQVSLREGDREGALRYYQRAYRNNYRSPKIFNNLGELYYTEGKKERAFRHFQTALRYNPDYIPALNNLGAMLMEKGRWAEAYALINQGLSIEPDSLVLHLTLGDWYLYRGRVQEAVETFRRGAEGTRDVDPENVAKLYNHLGAALLKEGESGEAKEAFEKALEIRPDFENARHNLKQMEASGNP